MKSQQKEFTLNDNLRKSRSRVTKFITEKQLVEEEDQSNFKQWIQSLYRMVQEIVAHILAASGEKKFKRMT